LFNLGRGLNYVVTLAVVLVEDFLSGREKEIRSLA
jgi:hypothetical protein